MNNNLILEKRSEPNTTPTLQTDKGSVLMMTPAIGEDYWAYRVKLYKDQAIIGFPKFTTIGIGFALEDDDWNTNLPYTCSSEQIVDHIWDNHKYNEITRKQAIEAIELIQNQVRKDLVATHTI